MQLIPAIDLLGGKVVRLFKGDMEKVTIYSDEPVDTARMFADLGVKRLHIVDLDGAREGESINFKVIEAIAKLGTLKIEAGGGIRSIERIDSYFSAGLSYAILGTVVVKDPQMTKSAMEKYPGRIILGIDARNGKVSTEGWYEDSELDVFALVDNYSAFKAESVIYTDINKDGTLTGLNLGELKSVAVRSPFPVIASGGVASEKDIYDLLEMKEPNIMGCIIGKAFYEGKIDLRKVMKMVSNI